jgi:hypothetical protein
MLNYLWYPGNSEQNRALIMNEHTAKILRTTWKVQ